MTKEVLGRELKGGLEWTETERGVFTVRGPEDSDGAFGESLEEAEQNYWKRRVAAVETDLVQQTKHRIRTTANLKYYRDLWEEQNKEMLDAFYQANEDTEKAEAELKAAAVRLFELTGDKKPSRYAEIKEKAGALIYETKEAISWCRENMKAAIEEVLNVKAFESFSGVEALDFVTKTDPVPTAQIARKKLSEAVGDDYGS